MFAGQDVAGFQIEIEGLQGHGAVVIQILLAHGKQFGGCRDAADAMEEITGGLDADGNVVEILFHFLHVGVVLEAGWAHGFEQVAQILQHIMADGHERGILDQRLADLMEEPRVADGTAADH